MCVITDSLRNAAGSADTTGCNSTNNTSWTQLFRKPLKPRLSRKIVSSARTNLNRYWSKFEELLATDATPSAASSINELAAGCRATSTRTSYRLMPPMLAALRQRRQKDAAASASYSAPPSPPPSPLQPQQPEPQHFVDLDRNNIAAEIEVLMRKRFTVEKNLARSSMYKHFTDDSLYHGVNLNGVGDDDGSSSDGELMSSNSSNCNSNCSSNRSSIASFEDAPKYPFTHRNLSMSFEDKENLENEAMEVYTTLGYETSF